jgi:hypothetical protein
MFGVLRCIAHNRTFAVVITLPGGRQAKGEISGRGVWNNGTLRLTARILYDFVKNL